MAHRRDTTARRQELFEEAAAIIAFEYAEPLTLDEVARRLFTSPRQLQRAFAEAGDGSFRSHLCRIRMERASDLLRDGATVAEAAHAVGYSQPAQFAKAFRRYRPQSPSAVRYRHAPAARMAETRPRRSSA
jgi:AraC family transcriptional regulator, regulatory protein of adaptative response / methylphosphotriester-DNA alkyltransferase methyltransferase